MTATFGTLRKLMSLSRGEFEASARALDGGAILEAAGDAIVACYLLGANGSARVRYAPLPPRTIGGGLLTLPQAEVTIEFENASTSEQQDFQRRFETSFQRGGG